MFYGASSGRGTTYLYRHAHTCYTYEHTFTRYTLYFFKCKQWKKGDSSIWAEGSTT